MVNKDKDENSIYAVEAKALGVGSVSLVKNLLGDAPTESLGDANAQAVNRPGNESNPSDGANGFMLTMALFDAVHPTGNLIEGMQKEIGGTRKESVQLTEHKTELKSKSPESQAKYQDLLLKKGASDIENLPILNPRPSVGHTLKDEAEEHSGVKPVHRGPGR